MISNHSDGNTHFKADYSKFNIYLFINTPYVMIPRHGHDAEEAMLLMRCQLPDEFAGDVTVFGRLVWPLAPRIRGNLPLGLKLSRQKLDFLCRDTHSAR